MSKVASGDLKWLCAILVLLLFALQYRLWLGSGGRAHIADLQGRISEQEAVNATLQDRNHSLIVEVRELQEGEEGLEEKARQEMGMIRQGETFFLYLPYEE